MEIRDLMSRNFEVVARDAHVKEAAIKMRDLDVSLLPVCDGATLIGVITIRDIALRLAAEGYDAMLTQVGEIMTRDLTYCYEDQAVDEAANVMESFQIDRLPVLDRERRIVGIISRSDIVGRAAARPVGGASEIAVLPADYAVASAGRR